MSDHRSPQAAPTEGAALPRPRWYRRGATVEADEVGAVKFRAPQSGWYVVVNHFGHVQAYRLPESFWQGWWKRGWRR